MTLRWIACEARSGNIIADLPDLIQTSPLKATLGRAESSSAVLPIPLAPDDWQRATRPGYAALVAVDQDEAGSDYPVWGGLVTQRRRGTDEHGDYVAEIGLTTVEGYFDRRYVGDHTYTAQQQTAIVAALALAHAGDADGLPLQFETAASSILRDRTYRDMDDMTLYSALTNLMGVINGPQWTVSWRYLDSPSRYVPVLQTADRIGVSPSGGRGPAAQFIMPGSVIAAQSVEDYGRGNGANAVTAVSSSQLDTRPQSPQQVADPDGRPRYEYRWMPSSSIIEIDTLVSHAQRALATLSPGSTVVTLTAQLVDAAGRFVAPRLGIDWFLGDDILYEIDHPAWPDGLTGTAQCIGWQRDPITISPILAVPALEATT